ncbi:MAG: protein kinase [Candidatus Levybacteria bacterium]|nr:protein kinase [Candidatus Levybacteria bacterium]
MTVITDPFQTLGLLPNADPAAIEGAWKGLARAYHPDKGGDPEIFVHINTAYEIISDPDKLARFMRDRGKKDDMIVGGYRIIEKIAEGGFGPTHKAEHLITGELVCIKFCSKVSTLRNQILIDEAKVVWDLRHYALPTMRDMLKMDDGSLALVMSYIPGDTLFKLVGDLGPLDPEGVSWIAERSLNALAYLHHNQIIHGDIKPQNIIVQPDKHMAVLIDFGLSSVKPTGTSRTIGYTELFAPPEQIAGKPPIPESDLYALGMTLIFALTRDPNLVKDKKVPKKTPDPFVEFISRLVREDPMERPHWGKEDLCETIQRVRLESFGRLHTGMKPLKAERS